MEASGEKQPSELEALVNSLQTRADQLSMADQFGDASLLLAARQAIRVLHTRLVQASTPSPAPPSDQGTDWAGTDEEKDQ